MSFEFFILQLKHNNPALFAAEKIQLSPKSLEIQLKRAYDCGHREATDKIPSKSDAGLDLFNTLFKKWASLKKSTT